MSHSFDLDYLDLGLVIHLTYLGYIGAHNLNIHTLCLHK